jgi:nitronate monooxygenase
VTFTLAALAHPIVQAPMAGGPSTPTLAAAVSRAGGLGFVAAGYRTPEQLQAEIAATRAAAGDQAIGVNIFVPSPAPADPAAVARYAELIAPLAAVAGVALGAPRFDDDHYDAKLAVVAAERPAVVSFAFGCPTAAAVDELRAAGLAVWVTVTDEAEARQAVAAGADALVAQGAEAGAHRGSFTDHDEAPLPLADLLPRALATGVPVVATGGLMDGAAIAAVLRAGAAAAQLGTAFLLCPEAGTSAVHRRAIAGAGLTTLTRAFTGRRARGIENRWTDQVGNTAPSAYPELHHLTAPLRAHGRAVEDPDLVNLWAGTNHHFARELPAAELVATLARELDS